MYDTRGGDRIGPDAPQRPVADDGLSVCGRRHTEPVWLGAIRGQQWWHCRSCGWVWQEPQSPSLTPLDPPDSSDPR